MNHSNDARHRLSPATLLRCLILAAVFLSSAAARDPVYLVLWFDTEDYIEPAADDAALRIATDLTNLQVRATFKIVGEKARVLEKRGRKDVIRALSLHSIGYHSNLHSIQPTPAVYLQHLGLVEGAAEFTRRESPGILDIKRIFGVLPVCYGQPGSSWGPQSYSALRRLGIPVYLDEGVQVGLDDQPFWYGGLLNIYNMGSYSIRPDLNPNADNRPVNQKLTAAAERLSTGGGGVISTYFHPTEFVTTEFWDAVNFRDGEVREPALWQRPNKRTPAETEHAFQVLSAYVATAKQLHIRFVTAQDLLELYQGPVSPAIDRRLAAESLKERITFLHTSAAEYSAADLLLQLLGIEPQVVEGPSFRGKTTYPSGTVPVWLFDTAKADTVSFIAANGRLPAEVFLGSQTLSLPDFAATLAGSVLSNGGPVAVLHGKLEFEKYFSADPQGAFQWPIHPKGFAAPELLELARLQGWTLKPTRLK